jgi:hypothetical protein
LLDDRTYRIGATMRVALAFGPPTVAAVVDAAIPYRNGSTEGNVSGLDRLGGRDSSDGCESGGKEDLGEHLGLYSG